MVVFDAFDDRINDHLVVFDDVEDHLLVFQIFQFLLPPILS